MTIANKAFYVAFGSYGITVLPQLSAEQIGGRETLAKMLKVSSDRLTQLEMFTFGTGGPETAAAVFKQVGKVSYMSDSSEISLNDILASALDIQLKGGAKIRLDSGITAVLAQTQWGKTTFTSRDLVPSLAASIPDEMIDYISFLEPIEDLSFDEAPVQVHWIANHSELFRTLVDFLLSSRRVCVIDSLRSFIYDSSVGGTAAGGMDAYLPIQLTALSNLAAQLGKHVIVTINPMMPAGTDEERGKFIDLQKRIESSVPTVMTSNASRSLAITMRGPSSPSSNTIAYMVPSFDIKKSQNSVTPGPMPSGVTQIMKAESVANVIAGVVASL